uniref:Uncharacterized protein n=1 Tax=Piliocolobus tephrosceles TaxID=591936 RepID=A0A8C9LRM8_9PRIM
MTCVVSQPRSSVCWPSSDVLSGPPRSGRGGPLALWGRACILYPSSATIFLPVVHLAPGPTTSHHLYNGTLGYRAISCW